MAEQVVTRTVINLSDMADTVQQQQQQQQQQQPAVPGVVVNQQQIFSSNKRQIIAVNHSAAVGADKRLVYGDYNGMVSGSIQIAGSETVEAFTGKLFPSAQTATLGRLRGPGGTVPSIGAALKNALIEKVVITRTASTTPSAHTLSLAQADGSGNIQLEPLSASDGKKAQEVIYIYTMPNGFVLNENAAFVLDQPIGEAMKVEFHTNGRVYSLGFM